MKKLILLFCTIVANANLIAQDNTFISTEQYSDETLFFEKVTIDYYHDTGRLNFIYEDSSKSYSLILAGCKVYFESENTKQTINCTTQESEKIEVVFYFNMYSSKNSMMFLNVNKIQILVKNVKTIWYLEIKEVNRMIFPFIVDEITTKE